MTRYSQRYVYYIKWQNVPVLSNYIHKKHYSVKVGSISLFSSSDMEKFHYLLGCHAIGINSSLIFFKCFVFFKFNMPSQKSDKNNSIRI